MARIRTRKPKGDIEDSGYYRAVNDTQIAKLMQKYQSTVIANGNELEQLIYEHSSHPNKFKNQRAYDTEKNTKFDLNTESAFIVKFKIERETEDEEEGKTKKIDCDAVLLESDKITVFEIKDGANFDTKKAEGEYKKLCEAARRFEAEDPLERRCLIGIVLWNCKDLSKSSFKHKAARSALITGRDFAQLRGINYAKLNKIRATDQEDNLKYVLSAAEDILVSHGYAVQSP